MGRQKRYDIFRVPVNISMQRMRRELEHAQPSVDTISTIGIDIEQVITVDTFSTTVSNDLSVDEVS